MLVMKVNATITLVAVEHLWLLDNQTLVTVQVSIVRLMCQLLEVASLYHFEHIADEVVGQFHVHHDVQLHAFGVVAEIAYPSESHHREHKDQCH